jgi:hypothetical protein
MSFQFIVNANILFIVNGNILIGRETPSSNVNLVNMVAECNARTLGSEAKLTSRRWH